MNNSTIQYLTNYVLSPISNNQSQDSAKTNSELSREEQLLEELQECKKRYATTVKAISDGVWEWNLESDCIVYSARWKSMVVSQEWEIQNNPVEWLVRIHPADINRLKQNLAACCQGKIEQFEMEYSLLHKDGQYRFMYCKCMAIKDARGKIGHLIGSQTDITERKQTETKLKRCDLYDRLTNLPHRQFFIERLQELSRLDRDENHLFGILYLDVDRFKNVNYNFGHLTGDLLIVEIVRKLKSCLRTQDMLARLGGDEFAVLLVDFNDPNCPSEVASRIQQEFSEPIKIAEDSILVTICIGIANPQLERNCLATKSKNDLIESLENAEIAMLQAKQKGQACSKVFESQWHLQNLEKSRSADDLRKAIEQEQFELNYQPIVRLKDEELIGFEALIRWQHPVWGLLDPADFIPLAEDTGLIVPMGWWVLRSACEQMVQWQEFCAESLFISVNISGKQFSQPYAGDIIAQILEETGLNPACLKLEITESEIIENIELVLSTVEKLKCLGVQLSMDDFGTGYSSLSYLHCLPIDTLKIDRCFIQGMEQDCHQLELVKTIIKLAQVFDLDLVAEGIESELQLRQLVDLKCKYGQGYLFSQAVTPAIAVTMLQTGSTVSN